MSSDAAVLSDCRDYPAFVSVPVRSTAPSTAIDLPAPPPAPSWTRWKPTPSTASPPAGSPTGPVVTLVVADVPPPRRWRGVLVRRIRRSARGRLLALHRL